MNTTSRIDRHASEAAILMRVLSELNATRRAGGDTYLPIREIAQLADTADSPAVRSRASRELDAFEGPRVDRLIDALRLARAANDSEAIAEMIDELEVASELAISPRVRAQAAYAIAC